jgi:hypothetical protein
MYCFQIADWAQRNSLPPRRAALGHRMGAAIDILPRLKAGDSSYYTDWSSR